MLKKLIRGIVADLLETDSSLFELDPSKNYILILPTDLSPTQVKASLENFRSKSNVAILHADHVQLIEVK